MDLQLVDIRAESKNDFLSLVLKDISLMNKISTARSSGSVRLMAYESLDLIQQLSSQSSATSY